jgi:hypothetical protein
MHPRCILYFSIYGFISRRSDTKRFSGCLSVCLLAVQEVRLDYPRWSLTRDAKTTGSLEEDIADERWNSKRQKKETHHSNSKHSRKPGAILIMAVLTDSKQHSHSWEAHSSSAGHESPPLPPSSYEKLKDFFTVFTIFRRIWSYPESAHTLKLNLFQIHFNTILSATNN